MTYLQHTDVEILVPQHISKNALYSAQFFVMLSIIAFNYKYYKMLLLLSLLYITSILHWRKVKYFSIIKTIDIILAFLTIITITLFDIHRFCNMYKNVWYFTVFIVLSAFIVNEILFYYQVLIYKNKIMNKYCKKYYYFSLEYTNPNTIQREYAYYRSTYTHMLFIHIIPSIVSGYCAIKSNYYC